MTYIDAGLGNDILRGTDFGAEDLRGNSGADHIFGGGGNDRLDGVAGIDILWGEAGNDTLLGGADNDDLRGGAGNDTLTGGTGIDRFFLNAPSQNGMDTITDFVRGTDKIAVYRTDFGISNIILTSNATGAASGTSAQFIYNTTNKALWFDADGTGATTATQIALFTNNILPLTSSDFVLLV